MKTAALTTLLALSIVSASVMADDRHHPEKESAGSGPMKNQGAMAMDKGDGMMDMDRIQGRMIEMQRLMDRIRKIEDPKERGELMHKHMEEMQGHMEQTHKLMSDMHGMMGKGMGAAAVTV